MGQIWLHIGSPKTGTTAIQGFLSRNEAALREGSGLNFVRAARSHIAHNHVVAATRSGEVGAVLGQIQDEIATLPDHTHVISSEMLFNPETARKLIAEMPDDLRANLKVICYIRRQDSYLEALYKQLLKNSRVAPDRQLFLGQAARRVRYLDALNAYAEGLGDAAIRLRPFSRDVLIGHDVITDFAAQVGLEMTDNLALPDPGVNKSLSVETSEMLATLGTTTQFNPREVIRELIRIDHPGTVRSGDVFTASQRLEFMQTMQDENREIIARFGIETPEFFAVSDLENAPADDPLARLQSSLDGRLAAQEAMLTAIGNLQKRAAETVEDAPEPDGPPTWYHEIYPAGPNRGWYNSFGDYSCSFVDRGAHQLVISFDNLSQAGNKLLAREPWAQKVCADWGYSHLGVYAQKSTWFRDAGLIAHLEKLRDDGFFEQFDRVALTGTSMGGFAALTFASLAPGCTVITFSPQSTLDTTLVPWEGRFAKGRAADWSLPFSDAAKQIAPAGKVYAIYDHFHTGDRGHIDRLSGDNLIRLNAPGFGHKSAMVLKRMGGLKTVMASGIDGTLTAPGFYSLIRSRKNVLLYRKEIEQHLTARGHPERALRFAKAFKQRRKLARAAE